MIETERLILREWKLSDAQALVNGLNEFDVAKFLTAPFPYKLQNAEDYIKRREISSSIAFAIVLKTNQEVIGGTSIKMNEDGTNSGGIWLNKNYHGQGLGTEAWVARAKFMFENLGAKVVQSGYFEFNERSGHMQQKIGGKVSGKKKNFCPALNSEVSEILIELNKSDFEKYLKSKKDFIS